MENKGFQEVWDVDITQAIQKLSSEASKLKGEIFRRVVMDREINKKNIQFFESFVNEFLKFWSEHAESIESALRSMSSIKDSEGIQTVEYEYVKNFIFAKYDYPAVLKFTEGIITGIEEEEFTKSSHIEDFKEHTISKAFNNQSPEVGGLLNSVLSTELGDRARRQVTPLDMKMFESVRTYNELFNRAARQELYQSIKKTIDYIIENDVIEEEKNFQNVKLFISFINNVVEFITYTLTAYATRVFIISRFVSPFIRRAQMESKRGEDSEPSSSEMSESFSGGWMDGVTREDISEDPRGNTSNSMIPLTEMVIKDPTKAKQFFESFYEMLRLIGVGTELTDRVATYENSYVGRDRLRTNKFYEKLEDNPLFDLIQKGAGYAMEHHTKESHVMEYHQNLKTFMYNRYQGLQGPTTARNELLHVIRGLECGESLGAFREQAKDLYHLGIHICKKLQESMKSVRGASDSEFNGEKMSIGAKKFLGECSKFLIDLYQEAMWAIAQKAVYIERRVNELNEKAVTKAEDFVALDIPGLTSDISLLHTTNLSVPATMRMPTEHQDLFSLPMFEELEMYNEYLRSLPEFAGNVYLTEGAIASIINAIKSLLNGLRKKVDDFFLSREFKSARDWVVKHKQELLGMVFTPDASINILPYKHEITMHEGFDNLRSGLQGFDPNTHAANPEELAKFIDGLYPSTTIRGWFKDHRLPADVMWKNLFLFGADKGATPYTETSVPNTEVVQVAVSGAEISTLLARWVDTIEKTEQTRTGFNDTNLSITNAINSLNSRLVNWQPAPAPGSAAAQGATGDATTGAGQAPAPAPGEVQTNSVVMENNQSQNTSPPNTGTPPAPAPPQPAGAPPASPTPGQPASPPPVQPAKADHAAIGTAVQQAVKDIWNPITAYTIKAVRDQYSYLKTAYSKGQGGTATAQPQQPAAQ